MHENNVPVQKRLLFELTMQAYIDEFASTYIEKECNKTILGRVFWDIKNMVRKIMVSGESFNLPLTHTRTS
jgi:uncharacterized protein YabN with tetrapyrrole methylase and pyrophosphatase domain